MCFFTMRAMSAQSWKGPGRIIGWCLGQIMTNDHRNLRFLTFEGVDGVGKTSQIARLAATLEAAGHHVTRIHEPKALEGRPLHPFLKGLIKELGPEGDAVVLMAARIERLHDVIRPALDRGDWVLCERFNDGTLAHLTVTSRPEFARAVSLVQDIVAGATLPSLTFFLDLPADNRTRLAAAYREIAASAPDRIRVIDASMPIDVVETRILEAFKAAFPDVLR